jgi:hypothetical protein
MKKLKIITLSVAFIILSFVFFVKELKEIKEAISTTRYISVFIPERSEVYTDKEMWEKSFEEKENLEFKIFTQRESITPLEQISENSDKTLFFFLLENDKTTIAIKPFLNSDKVKIVDFFHVPVGTHSVTTDEWIQKDSTNGQFWIREANLERRIDILVIPPIIFSVIIILIILLVSDITNFIINFIFKKFSQ